MITARRTNDHPVSATQRLAVGSRRRAVHPLRVAARTEPVRTLTARLSPVTGQVAGGIAAIAIAAWAGRHAMESALPTEITTALAPWYYLSFALLALQMVLANIDRPAKQPTKKQALQLQRLRVWALVPSYNEDPAALQACVMSLVNQIRKPSGIVVVDDGSTVDYMSVRFHLSAACRRAGIQLLWIRQDNLGKRHAQAAGVRATPHADVYLTADSDGIFDPHALDELLKPFARSQVASVAGIVLATNPTRSLLCRFTDLWFVSGQMVDRAALSAVKSVWVNSGPIAAYRAGVIRNNLTAYLGETFMGRRVTFSDDSMLTLYAMLSGETRQQSTAFVFSLMPESWSHHRRQYVRWMRGSFIRSWWRFKYLPMNRVAWWLHLARWIQVVGVTVLMPVVGVFVATGHINPLSLLWAAVIPMALGMTQTMRYLMVRRSDATFGWQIRTWLLTPLAVAWALIVLRAMRLYAVATCRDTGWGTRKSVEVTL